MTPKSARPIWVNKVPLNRHVLALLLVALVWGSTFPVLKFLTRSLGGMEVSALRFLIAAGCMLPFAWRAPRRAWVDGAVLGGVVLVSYVLQAYGLEHISSNRSAFLTSLSVLMVPLLGMAWAARPSWSVLAAAAWACIGIGLMSWEGGAHLWADSATALGALAYALYVMFLSRCAERHAARQLAGTQIVCMALLACCWMGVQASSTPFGLTTLLARLNGPVVAGLGYLGVVATAAMMFVQTAAQRHVAAEKAALIYAMEPVFAALFAWLWLGETMGLRALAGAAMVLMAVVFSEWRGAREQPKRSIS